MQITGWGRYPRIDAEVHRPRTLSALREVLEDDPRPLLARGLGRSYGDASLAPTVVALEDLDHFLDFDRARGVLRCAAGVPLEQILALTVPTGWFLPVVPGTGHVTVGGAIASDVHGKNHHRDGSFADHVAALTLLGADGTCTELERDDELFRATAGGMGLTGIIVDATLRLRAVDSSFVTERTIAAYGLNAALDVLTANESTHYAVAWLDTTRGGSARARALIMLGEHCEDGVFCPPPPRRLGVPLEAPFNLVRNPAMRLFNALYFLRGRDRERRCHYREFFHPLDAIAGWNRLYGPAGFLQYQCVVPTENGLEALGRILDTLAEAGRGSPLAVLKTLGPDNGNLLSFPRRGYTLTLDLPHDRRALDLVRRFDDIVAAHGGRIYLAKDACTSASTFRRVYPAWETFESARERCGASGRFTSLQSQRLGLA